MTVEELQAKLAAVGDPKAKVFMPGDGDMADAGTWLEGDPREVETVTFERGGVMLGP